MNEAHYYLTRPASRWFQIHPKNWNAQPVGIKAYSRVAHCECGWGVNGSPEKQEDIEAVQRAAQSHANKFPEHVVHAGTVRMRKNGYGRPPHHLKWLQNCGIPVYMHKVDKRVPTSVEYPYDEIVERYGSVWANGKKRPYLTSSAAYMLALVVLEHDRGQTVDKLYLAGIELAIGTEYFHQRPCVEHWLGIMKGKGIEVVQSPYGTSLLTGPIYAREHTQSLFPESLKAMEFTLPANAPLASVKEDEDGDPIGLDAAD